MHSRKTVIIETEHNAYSPSEKEKVLKTKEAEGLEIDEKVANLPSDTFGLPKHEGGKWASCIRVVNPFQGETTHLIELEENEAAFSVCHLLLVIGMCIKLSCSIYPYVILITNILLDYYISIATVSFHNHSNETFLVVGTAKDANLAPRTCTFGFIHVYRFINEGNQLELVHKVSLNIRLIVYM